MKSNPTTVVLNNPIVNVIAILIILQVAEMSLKPTIILNTYIWLYLNTGVAQL